MEELESASSYPPTPQLLLQPHLTPAQHLDLLSPSLSLQDESQLGRKSPEVRSFFHPLPLPTHTYQHTLRQSWNGTGATRSQHHSGLLPARGSRKALKVAPLFTSTNFFFFFFFLGPNPWHMWHMEFPRLGVKCELYLPAYTTATATQDPRCICDPHHSSGQCWILNPLHEDKV